jgi:hypothetical protein
VLLLLIDLFPLVSVTVNGFSLILVNALKQFVLILVRIKSFFGFLSLTASFAAFLFLTKSIFSFLSPFEYEYALILVLITFAFGSFHTSIKLQFLIVTFPFPKQFSFILPIKPIFLTPLAHVTHYSIVTFSF